MQQNRYGLTGWCAATALVSAFLLFQVQPIISKMILPWFGGSPAVWTTCMLFFQVFLLAGYLYAHLLDRLARTRWPGVIHAVLLVAALCALPIVPDPVWKPSDSGHPEWRILVLLTANVGLPYFLLAASAPLIQAWFSRAFRGRSPYRFYALSNFGSLAALLSYPFWIEPAFDIPAQGALWSRGFWGFAVLSGGLALAMVRWNLPAVHLAAEPASHVAVASPTGARQSVTLFRCLLWLMLPAFGSMSLLAVTNQICQDVAVVPFLWVVPLSLYLITFIICFDSERWYRRNVFAMATLVVVSMISAILLQEEVQPLVDALGVQYTIPDFLDSIALETVLYLGALFGVCMLCHGEVVRVKPMPTHLTLFYLCIAAGGALGGTFVALVCPKIFSGFSESAIFLVGGAGLALFVILHSWWQRERQWAAWWRGMIALPLLMVRDLTSSVVRRDLQGEPARQRRVFRYLRVIRRTRPWWTFWSILVPVPLFIGVALAAYVAGQYDRHNTTDLVSRRSFYGVLRVAEFDDDQPDARRNLYNGRILHGTQLLDEYRREEPTTYYSRDSGIGLTLLNLSQLLPLRVATVGLGTGTIAVYAEPGDYYCFYEINPDVMDIANEYFTYLSDARDAEATVHVEEGDARLSLEQQTPQGYDVIALDAFSSDAIPAHLLTVEAFDVYLKHLKPDGVLAVHTSNRHLDLRPIVALLAAHYQMHVVSVDAEDHGGVADSSSEWLLVTNNQQFLNSGDVAVVAIPVDQPGPEIRVWTDQYSNLFQILRSWHEEDAEEDSE